MWKKVLPFVALVAFALSGFAFIFLLRNDEREGLRNRIWDAVEATIAAPDLRSETEKKPATPVLIPTAETLAPCHPYFPLTRSQAVLFAVKTTAQADKSTESFIRVSILHENASSAYRRYQANFLWEFGGNVYVVCQDGYADILGTRLPTDEGALREWKKSEKDDCDMELSPDLRYLTLKCPPGEFTFEKTVGLVAYTSDNVTAKREE